MMLLLSLFTFACFEDYTGNFADPSEYHLGNPYTNCDSGNGMLITSINPSTNIKAGDEIEIYGSGFGTSEIAATVQTSNGYNPVSLTPTSDSYIKVNFPAGVTIPQTVQFKLYNVKLDFTSPETVGYKLDAATKWSNCYSLSLIP